MNEQLSDPRKLSRGIPQGSSLSVLLWQLYVSDMPIDPKTSALYMDDTALWKTAKTRSLLEKHSKKTSINHRMVPTEPYSDKYGQNRDYGQ